MEEREIKIVTKVFFAISIILGSIFLFFIWGINRVDALTSSASNWYVNGNKCLTNDWSGLGTISCINNANSNRSYTLRTNANMTMTTGKKYTFMYKATVTAYFSASSWTSNITNMYVSYNRSGTLGDVTSCDHTYSSTNYSNKKVYTIQASCKDVQFSQATDGFVIRVYFTNNQPVTGNGMEAKITQIYLEETGTDNSDITNSIDNSTTEIINNNNNNTEAIINANEAIGDAINSTIDGMKDAIIESGKVCTLNGEIPQSEYSQGYVGGNGQIVLVSTNEENYTTKFIKVSPNTQYTYKIVESSWSGFNNNNWIGIGQYTQEDYNSFVSRTTMTTTTQNYVTFTTSPTTNYIIISARGLNNAKTQFVLGGLSNATETCKNGNQSIFDKIAEMYGIDDWQKVNPDSTNENELSIYENELADYLIDSSDVEALDYEIEGNSAASIWGIFNDLITGNQIVFTGTLTILFFGVIKLILAR